MFTHMETTDSLDEILSCRLDLGKRLVEPCSIVIFGASGDLTARKLIPALYHLFVEKQLPNPVRIIGFARREKSDAQFREEMKAGIEQYSRTKKVDASAWEAFSTSLTYCQGEFSDPKAYLKLGEQLANQKDEGLRKNVLFYLSTSPSQFGEIAEHLAKAKLLVKGQEGKNWQRVVVEKPFGHDLASARQLNAELTRFAYEKQIYRIDHYLGKETVQNILMFRFSNAIFEQLWSRQAVDHVQLTVSEKLGVGTRGGYYEEAGALRDMVQNHLLQVLALVAMEPPVSLEAEAIRDEKVKLLKSIRPLQAAQVATQVVRGQYQAGYVEGQARPAYREEQKVRPNSNVETYIAARLMIDNWRWSGVPFYLRTGKNLPFSASEVRIQFKPTPNVLFAAQCGPKLDANAITLRLQPNEGIYLRFNGKVPGTSVQVRPVRMHFSYDSEFGAYTPEAYERLLLEAIAGDATLFIRRDEVETAWAIVDPIRQAWESLPLTESEFYPAGSWGPHASDALLAERGHTWRNPQPFPAPK
jgi:glucose-6-phosphate 1-dehydrogenase